MMHHLSLAHLDSGMTFNPSKKNLTQLKENQLRQSGGTSSDSEDEGQCYFSRASILPVPKVEQIQNKRKNRCQKSEIITSTPFKLSLLEKRQKQSNKGKSQDTKVYKKKTSQENWKK